ncbi:MAG: hypothetical protein SFW67_08900 [Myxococcaceae bacterium]|nr:hypothetical protein [Myxococcaceae bacterium]
MPFVRVVLVCCVSSSCAFPLVGATIALRAADEEQQQVEGYHRLLALRTREARTAAEIRERWNASNPFTPVSFQQPAPASPSTQPTRRPLKPAPR